MRKNPVVSLKMRVRMPNGKWTYLEPVYAANGKPKQRKQVRSGDRCCLA